MKGTMLSIQCLLRLVVSLIMSGREGPLLQCSLLMHSVGPHGVSSQRFPVPPQTSPRRYAIVMPCYADSHTHIVYAGNREGEFVDRINGLSYEEVAKRGGGIINSVELLRKTSEEDLFRQSLIRFNEIIKTGTGAVEIKSGYGLNLE